MGCSLYACKRLRGARRTREYQREREENPAMSSRVFSSFPFYRRTFFFPLQQGRESRARSDFSYLRPARETSVRLAVLSRFVENRLRLSIFG